MRRTVPGKEQRNTPRKSVEDLVVPVRYDVRRPNAVASPIHGNVVKRQEASAILEQFCRRREVRELAEQHGITDKLFMRCYQKFRDRCLDPGQRGEALEVLLSDIRDHNHSVDMLSPHFIEHSRRVFPHLEALEELKHISDLTQPHTWYEATRSIHRKVFFHAGRRAGGGPVRA